MPATGSVFLNRLLGLDPDYLEANTLQSCSSITIMLFVLLLVACTAQTVLGQCLTPMDNRDHKKPESRRDLIRSQLDFSLNLLKTVGRLQPEDNIFMSPLSVYKALLLAFFTSRTHTEESLRKALLLPNDQNKLDMMLSYRVEKIKTAGVEYTSQAHTADHLFISVNQTVRDCMAELFDGEIEMLDFSPKGLGHAVDSINGWVANQTHNLIQNLVSADSINPSTQLILANVAYFKGIWKHQFDERDTGKGRFYVTETKAISIPMMYQRNTFSHSRSDKLGAEILEMPYKGYEGGNISMIILLPDITNATYPAAQLLQRLDSDTLRNIIREATDPKNRDEIDVKMPKFTVERTLELAPVLEELGVGDLFKSTSDLTGLTLGAKIRLNSAIHKAKIQVVEKGTEAAAATAFTDTRISSEGFLCDRPFLYLLYDKTRETLLFAGLYTDPNK